MTDQRTNNSHGFRVVSLVLLCFSFVALFILSYYAPTLAERERITTPAMVLLSFIPTYIYGAFAIGALFWFLFCGKQLVVLFACILAAGMAFVHKATITPASRNSRFVDMFAERILRDVKVERLNALFDRLESEVKTGKRADFYVRRSELPEQLRKMYWRERPEAKVVFVDNEVLLLEIYWGGPLYRWGIEVRQDLSVGGSGHVARRQISTNMVCFVAN